MSRHSGFSFAVGAVLVLAAIPALSDVQVNSADHNATNLGNFTTESETSVARSGSTVVVGYNTSRQAGLLGAGMWKSLSGYAWSNNGGASFTDAGFVPAGTAQLEGDPALAYDSAGNLYYASIGINASGISRIFVSKSTTAVPAFASPVEIPGLLSGTAPFQDKESIAVDASGGAFNGRVYVAWSEFATNFNTNPRVLVAASTTASSLAFGATQALSPATGFHHGATVAVGPGGEVYVAWSTFSNFQNPSNTTVNLVKSTNGGAGFGNPDVSDLNPSKTVATFTSTVGDIGTGSVSVRTRAFPYVAVDNTPAGSPTRGNVYVVFQARPTASASPRSEIFFTRSTDGGVTWAAPRDITSGPAVTLNGDTTMNDNWMPSISVSPVTGHIKVLLYSRRQDGLNQNIRVYEAGSTDGGITWYANPFSAVAFGPSTGYDPLLVPNYMGDYIHALADSNGLIGAWGDTRNQCAPPGGASAPCSPAGRGDQDAWSLAEGDATGVDLFITPWGYVSGDGPLWQTPDIFVVDSMNNIVNAQINVNNGLRGRVRNLGNAAANGATVTFSFSPYGVGLPGPVFEQIGAPVSANFTASSGQVIPINWFLDPNDNNGGAWNGLKVSDFNHFCVQVNVAHAADINLSNNSAQNNFVDVTTGAMKPFKFLVGNPFKRDVRARLVLSDLPKGYAARLEGVPPQDYISLKPGEMRLASLSLVRPPGYEREKRTRDVVASVSLVIDGRAVGGISIGLAKANVAGKKPYSATKLRVSSVRSSKPEAPMPESKPPAEARVFVAVSVQAVVRAVAEQLHQQEIPVAVADEKTGIVSSGSVPLSYEQLVAAIPPEFARSLPREARGRYLMSFAARPLEGERTEMRVSTRIILAASQTDSPIGGRTVPSNGSLEQRQIELLAQRLKVSKK
jgi:hypothetical protein